MIAYTIILFIRRLNEELLILIDGKHPKIAKQSQKAHSLNCSGSSALDRQVEAPDNL